MKTLISEGSENLERFKSETSTIPQMFYNTAVENGSKPANTFKLCREWRTISYSEWLGIAEEIALALIRRGVRKGDDIAIMSNVCAQREWISMGIMMCAAVANTVTPLVDDEELKYIINRSDIKYLFVENLAMLEKALSLRNQMPSLKGIICFDERYRGGRNNLWGLPDFRMLGINRSLRPVDIKSYWMRLTPEDPAILDYSKSTIGHLKCTLIKHGDWAKAEYGQNPRALYEGQPDKYSNVLTCCLPSSTTQEWVSRFYSLVAIGAQIKYGSGPSRLNRMQDLKKYRQTATV